MKVENSSASTNEGSRCIVLIDDSCIQARIFSEQAGPLQYTVKVARTEAQALTLLQQHAALIIFIELHLLCSNGFAVGQSVMAQSQVPCVLLTGLLKNTDREWATQLGFIDVLERPLKNNDVQNVIESVVENVIKSRVEHTRASGAEPV